MNEPRTQASRELMEVFSLFHHLNWNRSPIAGLKPSEIRVLHVIGRKVAPESPGISVSGISDLMRVTSPTVTQLVNRLEADGFVQRSTDQRDKRTVRIRLTDKGEGAVSKAVEAFHATFDGLVQFLGEEESKRLAELLSKVLAYFDLNQR